MIWTALWDQDALLLQWGVPAVASFLGAASDLRTGRIPNLLALSVLTTGLVWAGMAAGIAGLADAAAGCLILILPYLLLFIFASGGAGDAKLMGALGVWLGAVNALVTLTCVALAGIVLGAGYAVVRRRLGEVMTNVGWTVKIALFHWIAHGGPQGMSLRPVRAESQKMPYGPAIFLGVCMAAAGVWLWRMR